MTSFTAGFKHHHHINAKNALTLQLGQDQTFCLETGELSLATHHLKIPGVWASKVRGEATEEGEI